MITIKAKSTNLSSSLEDYLETIFNLVENGRVARSKDIAEALGVAKPSVTGALKVLSEKGLVNYEPYGYITLTEAGAKRASAIARKHDIIESFFKNILGVDSEAAETAACKVEHSLGPDIISRLLSLTDFINMKSQQGPDLINEFLNFHKASSEEENKV